MAGLGEGPDGAGFPPQATRIATDKALNASRLRAIPAHNYACCIIFRQERNMSPRTRSRTPATARLANIFGALSISVSDRLLGGHGLGGFGAPIDHVTAGAAVSLLRWMPGIPMPRLAGYLGLSQSAAVRLIDRLAGADLVVRSREPGQHQVRVRVTRRGAATARRIHRARARVLERLVQDLSARDRQDLLRVSEQLARRLPNDHSHAMHVCRLCHFRSCGDDQECPVWDAVRPRSSRERA